MLSRYMYCSRCNQFMGTSNVLLPPHVLPPYGHHQEVFNTNNNNNNGGNSNVNNNTMYEGLPEVKIHRISDQLHQPSVSGGVSGTFQRLGMRASGPGLRAPFATQLEANALSPIQVSGSNG